MKGWLRYPGLMAPDSGWVEGGYSLYNPDCHCHHCKGANS